MPEKPENPLQCTALNRPYLVGTHDGKKQAVIFRARCGKWDCPYCAAKNAGRWIATAVHGSQELRARGEVLKFATITARGDVSAERSIKIFQEAWPVLNRRITRGHVGDFEYFGVAERQKRGHMHLHFIWTAIVKQSWLKTNCAKLGLGHQARIKPIDDEAGVARYISPYMVKAQGDPLTWPKGFRRVRVSQGWPELPEGEYEEGWTYVTLWNDGEVVFEYNMLEQSGYEVMIADEGILERFPNLLGQGSSNAAQSLLNG